MEQRHIRRGAQDDKDNAVRRPSVVAVLIVANHADAESLSSLGNGLHTAA